MAENKKILDLVDRTENGIISKKILSGNNGHVTLFSFDKGQSLSEHTSPHQVFLQALDGESNFTLSGKSMKFKQGEFLLLKPNESHALEALTPFKMLMVLLKD